MADVEPPDELPDPLDGMYVDGNLVVTAEVLEEWMSAERWVTLEENR